MPAPSMPAPSQPSAFMHALPWIVFIVLVVLLASLGWLIWSRFVAPPHRAPPAVRVPEAVVPTSTVQPKVEVPSPPAISSEGPPFAPISAAPVPVVSTTPVEPVPVAAPPVSMPTTGPEDILKTEQEREQAERALQEYTLRQSQLKSQGAAFWGGNDYASVLTLGGEADTLLLNKNYRAASEKWQQALRILRELDERRDDAFITMVKSGNAALIRDDADKALAHFEAANALRPGDEAVSKGLARAKAMPGMLDRLNEGLRREAAGDLDLALASLSEAARLDSEHTGAREAFTRVKGVLDEQRYQSLMSAGVAAWRERRFEDARAAYFEAGKIRPGEPAVRDGLVQVEEGMRTARIEDLLKRGRTAMDEEAWEAAIRAFEEILAIDGSVSDARMGAPQARARLSLLARMKAFLEKPELLTAEAGRREALSLGAEARDAGPLPPRLENTRLEFDALVRQMTTEVPVRITSDNRTDIAIFKVGRYEPFPERVFDLRPGTYQVVGSRAGYRDVRVSVVVPPGGPEVAVRVVCTEAIR